VEIDGGIHNQQEEYDDGRSAEMEKYDIKTIRFSNYEVENNIDKIVLEIKAIVNERLKSPPWGI
jgi:very-short-patch-repair endonuclease